MLIWKQTDSGAMTSSSLSEEDTDRIGQSIAAQLQSGDVIALVGDLGAGKTRFVKAVAAGCEVPLDEVNSPTFTLIQEYQGRVLLRHCDTYRLRSTDEFFDLGLDELFADDGVALVEWADRVEGDLPRDRLTVRITIDSPTARTFEISASGTRSNAILSRLMN